MSWAMCAAEREWQIYISCNDFQLYKLKPLNTGWFGHWKKKISCFRTRISSKEDIKYRAFLQLFFWNEAQQNPFTTKYIIWWGLFPALLRWYALRAFEERPWCRVFFSRTKKTCLYIRFHFTNFIIFHQCNLQKLLAVQYFDSIMFTLNFIFSR